MGKIINPKVQAFVEGMAPEEEEIFWERHAIVSMDWSDTMAERTAMENVLRVRKRASEKGKTA